MKETRDFKSRITAGRKSMNSFSIGNRISKSPNILNGKYKEDAWNKLKSIMSQSVTKVYRVFMGNIKRMLGE